MNNEEAFKIDEHAARRQAIRDGLLIQMGDTRILFERRLWDRRLSSFCAPRDLLKEYFRVAESAPDHFITAEFGYQNWICRVSTWSDEDGLQGMTFTEVQEDNYGDLKTRLDER